MLCSLVKLPRKAIFNLITKRAVKRATFCGFEWHLKQFIWQSIKPQSHHCQVTLIDVIQVLIILRFHIFTATTEVNWVFVLADSTAYALVLDICPVSASDLSTVLRRLCSRSFGHVLCCCTGSWLVESNLSSCKGKQRPENERSNSNKNGNIATASVCLVHGLFCVHRIHPF